MSRKAEKNPYDIHLVGIRMEFWKKQKLEAMAAWEDRSINQMINRWVDREIRKWERKNNEN